MRLGMLSRWFVAGSSALLLLGTNVPADAATTNSANSYEYQGTWEYRWGDSPRQTDTFAWASPTLNDGWRSMRDISAHEGRGRQRFMWMRTRLEGQTFDDPILHLRGVDQIFEAYVDGQLVYHFGNFDGPDALRFLGHKPHDIPLGSKYSGKTLALRIYSDHVNIGPFGQPQIGPRAELTVANIRSDLPVLGMGVILLALSAFILALYSWDRKDRGHLLYGLLTLTLGVYLPAASPLRSLLVDAPLGWLHIELGSLYLMPIVFAAYIDHMFGPDRYRLLRVLRLAHAAYFAGALLAVTLGLVDPLHTLLPFQVLLLLSIALIGIRSIIGAIRGDLDARIFGVGFAIASTTAVYDILKALGFISRANPSLGHVGMFLFTLSLGLIVARRFMAAQERASKYSRILDLSLASAQVLERGQHARVGLDEILRLLPARKALLFVMKPGPNADLDLAAAREPGDKEIPTEKVEYDKEIVEQVRTKRLPVMHKRVAGTRKTVMAEPLIVRDELLGVLYLEGDGAPRGLQETDRSILHILGEKLSITIVTTRAIRAELDSAVQKKLIGKQTVLLDAVARLAAGDIETPIVVEGHGQFADLARALDAMRRDVQAKIHTIEAKKAEVEILNEELRRKIQQHTTSLLSSLRDDDEMDEDDELVDENGPTFEPGTVIADRYRVSGDLGQGAMGAVYDVERLRDGRHFAMKVLTSRRDRVAMTRMVREAQILARMDHPNLASIADVDVTPDGVLYLVMELCEGEPLQRHKARYRDVPWALSVLRQMAQGLAAVHAQGVIHRDLKPGNVMVFENAHGIPSVKLVDFGISTLTREAMDSGPVSERGRDETAPVSRRAMPTLSGLDVAPRDLDLPPNSRRPMPSSPGLEAVSRDMDLPPNSRRLAPTLSAIDSTSKDSDLPPVSRRFTTAAPAVPSYDFNDPGPPSRRAGPTLSNMPSFDASDLPPPSRRPSPTISNLPSVDISDAPPPSRRSSSGLSAFRDIDAAPVSRRSVPPPAQEVTRTGILVGTPTYMGPELAQGSKQWKAHSDVFSFGVMGYEILTGKKAFHVPPIFAGMQGQPLPRPTGLRRVKGLDPDIAALFERCMDADPSKRPTAAEVADRLARAEEAIARAG